MQKFFLFLGLLFFFMVGKMYAQIRTISNPCEVYGVVYVEKIRSRADFVVYVEQEDDFLASLRVFKEDNKLFANRAGMWCFVETQAFADFSIFLTEDRAMADFIISYTDREFMAGCVK
jgi:hypothetical protein